MRWDNGDVLLTNDAGEYTFVTRQAFQQFHEGCLAHSESTYDDLKAKHMLSDGDPTLPLHLLTAKVRTKKSFLNGGVKLHLFVVTLRCDHSCPYCQVSRVT